MTKIVECVPNFSEGKDKSVIEAISGAIKSVPGVKLLDVDPGADFNRTVYTFVGEPDAVLEAAFQSARIGLSLIDMRKHKEIEILQKFIDYKKGQKSKPWGYTK